ncbi:AMIN-like domain-containing (lipo)protein [Nocardioides limicola]|uniref:AMIN-like domain-containing (lipo)protein n=1 Tax=Nocardioides limicola TaxID=2803368 RepID=UPI00193C5288|nr:hypothetical protein [Nocardioides sp. DJM-14]
MTLSIARRRTAVLALSGILAVVPVLTLAPPAAPATCATEWGSLAKKKPGFTGKQIVNLRSGQHPCFDRLVVDINAAGPGKPGYRVRYVKQVSMDGSGDAVPLRGGARIQVIVRAPAYNDQGRLTYRPANRRELVDVSGYRTFRQVAWAGSFEGQTTIGLGVRARLPMRVFVLPRAGGGHRVVIDVAHRWTQ